MAQFIPVIATIGAGVLSAVSARYAGIAQKQAYKQQATQERDAARQREVERRRNLLRALSSQNASAAARGVAFSGGVAAIAQQDIKEAQEDLLVDRVNSKRKIAAFKAAGRNAKQQGNLEAVGSLLDTAGKAYTQL